MGRRVGGGCHPEGLPGAGRCTVSLAPPGCHVSSGWWVCFSLLTRGARQLPLKLTEDLGVIKSPPFPQIPVPPQLVQVPEIPRWNHVWLRASVPGKPC